MGLKPISAVLSQLFSIDFRCHLTGKLPGALRAWTTRFLSLCHVFILESILRHCMALQDSMIRACASTV